MCYWTWESEHTNKMCIDNYLFGKGLSAGEGEVPTKTSDDSYCEVSPTGHTMQLRQSILNYPNQRCAHHHLSLLYHPVNT